MSSPNASIMMQWKKIIEDASLTEKTSSQLEIEVINYIIKNR